MPFLPFLSMTPTSPRSVRPGIDVDEYGFALPKNALPLPPPIAQNQSTNALDGNLIAQLENSKYGQSNNQNIPLIGQQQSEEIQPNQTTLNTLSTPEESSSNYKLMQTSTMSPLGSNVDKQLLEQLRQQYQEASGLQKQSVSEAEKRLQESLQKPQQMDISPLIALADAWSQRPMGLVNLYQKPEDKQKTIQALQDAVLKARGGLTGVQLQALEKEMDIQNKAQDRAEKRQEFDLRRAELQATKAAKQAKDQTDLDLKVQSLIDKSKDNEAINGIIELNNSINNYKAILDEVGLSPKGDINTAKLKTAHTAIMNGIRKAEGLGVLQKADMEFAESRIPDATSITGYIKSVGGFGPTKSQLSGLLDEIKQDYASRASKNIQNIKRGFGRFGASDYINSLENNLNQTIYSSQKTPYVEGEKKELKFENLTPEQQQWLIKNRGKK